MFKRVTWLGVGAVAGFGASKWLERKARQRLARYLPAAQLEAGIEVAGKAREAAATKVAELRHAIESGRDAMVAREAQLRRQLRLDDLSADRPPVDRQPVAPRHAEGGPGDGRRGGGQSPGAGRT